MIMANGSQWLFDDDVTFNDDEPISMDIDTFFAMLDAAISRRDYSQYETADPSSSSTQCSESVSGVGVNEHPQTHDGSIAFSTPFQSKASAFRPFCARATETQKFNSGFEKQESHQAMFPEPWLTILAGQLEEISQAVRGMQQAYSTIDSRLGSLESRSTTVWRYIRDRDHFLASHLLDPVTAAAFPAFPTIFDDPASTSAAPTVPSSSSPATADAAHSDQPPHP